MDAGRDLDLLVVLDRPELDERALGVLGGVERLVEVDLELRRLGAQLGFRVARPRGRSPYGSTDRLDASSATCSPARRRVGASPPRDGLGERDGRRVRVGVLRGRRPRPSSGLRFSQRARAWRTPRAACPSPAARASRARRSRPWRGSGPGTRPSRARASGRSGRGGRGSGATASSVAGSNANGIRLRIDSFGLPWNMPQSMRTRARSVTSRNCEPVTVVAPPRKWISIRRMVTGARVSARGRRRSVGGAVIGADRPARAVRAARGGMGRPPRGVRDPARGLAPRAPADR